jgi:hypothetical protein
MKSNQIYYVEKTVIENGQKLLKKTAIDIFDVKNEKGEALGWLIDSLIERNIKLTERINALYNADMLWKQETNAVLQNIIEKLNEGE